MDSEGNRLTYRMKQTAAKVVPRVENSENCARSGPLVHLSAKLVLQGRMWAGERTAFLSLMNVPKFLFCGELHSFRAEMPTSTIPSKSLLVVSPSSSSASANIESQVLPPSVAGYHSYLKAVHSYLHQQESHQSLILEQP
ncbi:unnamed protein product, partial [Arabidopsis halleri]